MGPTLDHLPEPPYYAVIFTSERSGTADEAYADVADRMAGLAAQQQGFLGMTSFRNDDGSGVTISYWTDRKAIENWRENAKHRLAQEQGRRIFYDAFRLEICRVERASRYSRDSSKQKEDE